MKEDYLESLRIQIYERIEARIHALKLSSFKKYFIYNYCIKLFKRTELYNLSMNSDVIIQK